MSVAQWMLKQVQHDGRFGGGGVTLKPSIAFMRGLASEGMTDGKHLPRPPIPPALSFWRTFG